MADRMKHGIARILDILSSAFRRPTARPVDAKPAGPPVLPTGAADALIEDEAALASWFSAHGNCPDCGNDTFRDGPRGGLAQNIACERCGSKFNVTIFDGRCVFAQRIDRGGRAAGRTLH